MGLHTVWWCGREEMRVWWLCMIIKRNMSGLWVGILTSTFVQFKCFIGVNFYRNKFFWRWNWLLLSLRVCVSVCVCVYACVCVCIACMHASLHVCEDEMHTKVWIMMGILVCVYIHQRDVMLPRICCSFLPLESSASPLKGVFTVTNVWRKVVIIHTHCMHTTCRWWG